MKRDVLCFGGIALDYILVVNKLPRANENVQVEKFSINFGGAAANVAVAISKLGKSSGLVSVVGKDFMNSGYRHYLFELKIDLRTVFECHEIYLPRCILISKGDDQMILYYEEREKIKEILFENIGSILHVAKNYKILHFSTGHFEFYLEFLKKYNKLENQYISFDPGQQTFSETELVSKIIEYVDFLFMNEYEWKTLSEYLGVESPFDIKKVKLIVISKGEKGADIYYKDKIYHIPIAKPKEIVDPTGCGDAHRAAFLVGILNNWEIEKIGKFAAAVASFVIEKEGAQTNLPTFEEAIKRYEENFGKF